MVKSGICNSRLPRTLRRQEADYPTDLAVCRFSFVCLVETWNNETNFVMFARVYDDNICFLIFLSTSFIISFFPVLDLENWIEDLPNSNFLPKNHTTGGLQSK